MLETFPELADNGYHLGDRIGLWASEQGFIYEA
jgi:hypothetical protein